MADVGSTSPESARRAYQKSFVAKVQRFMVTNTQVFNELTKDAMFDLSSKPPKSNYYGDPLPLEYVMGVPAHVCQQRLLQLLTPGDIVRGHVLLKTPLALGVQITSLVASSKVRDFSGLEIRGLVQHENLATEKSRCEGVLKEMETDDVIQAVVVNQQDSHFNLSFSADHASRLCPHGSLPQGVRLGYLEGARAASNRKRPTSPDLLLSELEGFSGFGNPCSSDNLKQELRVAGYGIGTKPSLIKAIQTAEYPMSDYFDDLRKVQRHKWSLDTVGIGVDLFKKGEVREALKLLNHALDIDPTNVEGLVARGALSSNAGKYGEAIIDFEAALTINHTHKNARKYLVEAQVSYGEELERQGRLERAILCYQEAVTDDPSQEAAKTRLELLKMVLEKKAAEKVKRERKEAAEKARLKKLHSLIKEEKEKKKKTKVKKRKKEKKHVRVKKRKKTYARRTLKHADTDSSDSSVSSRSRGSLDARKECYSSRSSSTLRRTHSRESLLDKRQHYSSPSPHTRVKRSCSQEPPEAKRRNSSRSPSSPHTRVKRSSSRESLEAKRRNSSPSPSTSHKRVRRSRSREYLDAKERKSCSPSTSNSPSTFHKRTRSREPLDDKKRQLYRSRSPSTPPHRSKGTKRRTSPSHPSSWYKKTKSYVRSKLRPSESPKGKKSRSPSPRGSRRTFSRSPSPRHKRSSPLTPKSMRTRSPSPRSPSPKSKRPHRSVHSPSPKHSHSSYRQGRSGSSLCRESIGTTHSNSRIPAAYRP